MKKLMSRSVLLLTLGLVVGSCVQRIPEADWDLVHDFDRLPEDATPVWEAKNNNEPNGTQGSIIVDPDDAANHLYYINDKPGAKTGRCVPLDVDLSVGLTIIARAKCASGGHPLSLCIGWYDEGYIRGECVIWPDRFQLGRGFDIPITDEFDISGSEWHIYRITVEGNDVTVYVDEDTKPKIESKTLQYNADDTEEDADKRPTEVAGKDIEEDASKHTRNPGVIIGSQSTIGTQEIYFDYILVDLSGAYAPGEGAHIPANLKGANLE